MGEHAGQRLAAPVPDILVLRAESSQEEGGQASVEPRGRRVLLLFLLFVIRLLLASWCRPRSRKEGVVSDGVLSLLLLLPPSRLTLLGERSHELGDKLDNPVRYRYSLLYDQYPTQAPLERILERPLSDELEPPAFASDLSDGRRGRMDLAQEEEVLAVVGCVLLGLVEDLR